jgi:hypothetical protein
LHAAKRSRREDELTKMARVEEAVLTERAQHCEVTRGQYDVRVRLAWPNESRRLHRV